MEFASFKTEDAAIQHKSQHGGWLFFSDVASKPLSLWFAPNFTPSQIMLHPMTKGVSGRLV